MRITLVEDNVSLAKGIAYRLEDVGHSVDMLQDGNAAGDFLKSDNSDLVILDKASDALVVGKVLTSYPDPSEAVLNGTKQLLS